MGNSYIPLAEMSDLDYTMGTVASSPGHFFSIRPEKGKNEFVPSALLEKIWPGDEAMGTASQSNLTVN